MHGTTLQAVDRNGHFRASHMNVSLILIIDAGVGSWFSFLFECCCIALTENLLPSSFSRIKTEGFVSLLL